MSRNHPAIDFAQAVLSKYPDARAMSFGPSMNETWRIYAGHKIGWLSDLTPDRDAAWEDAYKRIYRQERKSQNPALDESDVHP